MIGWLDNSALFDGQGRWLEMHGLGRIDERECGEETLKRYGGAVSGAVGGLQSQRQDAEAGSEP